MATKLDIINDALNCLGEPPLGSLETQNSGLQGIIRAYEMIVDNALCNIPWTFALKTVDLTPDGTVTPPLPTYQYTYHTPADMLWAYRTYPLSFNYIIQGKYIYSNQSTTWKLVYIWRATEDYFPTYFQLYLSYQLAANNALMLTEDANKVQIWEQAAKEQLSKAKYLDQAQQPSRVIASNPLWETHHYAAF
jgi:hypothetical protein